MRELGQATCAAVFEHCVSERTTLSQNWPRGYSGQTNPSSKMKATVAPRQQFALFVSAILRRLASFASFVGIVSEKVSH